MTEIMQNRYDSRIQGHINKWPSVHYSDGTINLKWVGISEGFQSNLIGVSKLNADSDS